MTDRLTPQADRPPCLPTHLWLRGAGSLGPLGGPSSRWAGSARPVWVLGLLKPSLGVANRATVPGGPAASQSVVALTAGPQVLLGVEVALQHALVEEHVAHGLRDDDVHLLGERHLLYLAGDDHNAVHQVVALHQDLQASDMGYGVPVPKYRRWPLADVAASPARGLRAPAGSPDPRPSGACCGEWGRGIGSAGRDWGHSSHTRLLLEPVLGAQG